MKWLRLLGLVLLTATTLLVAVLLIVLGPLRGWVTEVARQRTEGALAAALHAPVAIGALRVELLPPRLEADAVVFGPDGALARAAHVAVRLLPRASLRQGRPVAEATVDDVFVDVPRWVALLASPLPTPPTLVPAFRLDALRASRASVRLSAGDAPLDLNATGIAGELEADALGRLHFGADLQQAALMRRGAALALTRARVRGGETPDGWRLTAVEAVGDGVELASAEPQGDRLPIRGRIALPRLAFASEVFERLGGDAEVDAALIGRLEQPAAAGTLRVANFTANGESVGDVSASAEWNLHTLTVSSARLAGFGGDVEASGNLAMEAPFTYRATLSWRDLDLQRLARVGPQAIKPSAASGQATLSGTLEPLVVVADGGGSVVAVHGGAALEWHGQGRYRDGAGAGEIEATQTPANTVRAQIGVGAGGALTGSLDLTVGNPTALGALLPVEGVPNLGGALSAAVQVSGTVYDPRASGQLSGRNVTVLGLSIEQLRGDFSLDRAALRTQGITAELWQGSIALRGTLALDAAGENEWQLQAVDVPGDAVVGLVFALTGSVPPIGRGTVAVELSGRGPWRRVQVDGHATMVNFWLSSEWIQQAEVTGSATWPGWQVEGQLRNRAGQTVALRGGGSAADDLAVEVHSGAWELTSLRRGELSETGGTLMLDASLKGPLRALSGRAALRVRELVVYGRRIGAVDLDADAAHGRWRITASALDDALKLRAGLTPDPGWPFTLDGDWTDLHFGRLLAPDADVFGESSGTLEWRGRLTALAQSEGAVRVQKLRIANGPFELSAPQPMRVECRRGACTFEGIELRGADTDVRASGSVAVGGAARVVITGQGDLRLLELAGGVIESARGRFTLDVELRRGAGGWDVSGELRFDQAGLDVGAPVAVTRTSGRLTLSGTTLRIDRLEGRMGTGSFAVAGSIDLLHGPDLSWTLTDVGADPLPSLEVELSGRGSLAGTWEHLRVSGEIDVARMLYDRDIALTDFLPSLNRALAAPRQPSARRIDLDLHVVAPGELYVENNVARIEARADLTIAGTAERPVLQGRIEALDGTVTFRDRTFELQGGTVDFRPDLGLAAALNIAAESTIDTPDATYLVDVRITGTTTEPRVTMSSDDPSLSQTDIATLIAVGKTTAQLRESGGGFSIYDALAAVPNQLSGPLTQGTKQLLPIDRISFESTYSRTTGTFEPQLKLGKDLTDNLAVSIGQTFGVESRTNAEADYRLTQRVYIPLTWESQTSTQQGAFGAGVKVRYEFWRVTPFTLLGGLR